MPVLGIKIFITLTFFTFFFCTEKIKAQDYKIKGHLYDSLEKKPIKNASVYLIDAKDSFLISFSRSSESGLFELSFNEKPDHSKVIIVVNYPEYAEYFDEVNLTVGTRIYDLKKIYLTNKIHLLQEVIVKDNLRAIRIKGDTTIFIADSFHLARGAITEDLIKKLPGFKVDLKGHIQFQGERIKTILIDGEEFFGNDPLLTTQNLRADLIDKVQVYDNNADPLKSNFNTGSSGGKVINLKLKKNKKREVFGKLNAGHDVDNYYDSKSIFNQFTDQKKLALYSIISDVGQFDLSSSEQNKYAEESGPSIENSNSWDMDTWNGEFIGYGFPTASTQGIHFSNKWNNDQASINSNYKLVNLSIKGNAYSKNYFFSKDSSYKMSDSLALNNSISTNKIFTVYQRANIKKWNLKLEINGFSAHKNIDEYSESDITDNANILRSKSTTRNLSGLTLKFLSSNFILKRTFSNPRKIFSVNYVHGYNNILGDGFLNSSNSFYSTQSNLISMEHIDQFKRFDFSQSTSDIKMNFSQPVSDKSFLVFTANNLWTTNQSIRLSFNKDMSLSYIAIDTIHSSNYAYSINTQKIGVGFTTTPAKFYLISGIDIGFTNLSQKDKFSNFNYNKNYINIYPKIIFSYNFLNNKRLLFSYNGFTTQPTLAQTQPVKSNSNSLNVNVGNLLLKPSFTNTIAVKYFTYNTLKKNHFIARAQLSVFSNSFSTSAAVDSNYIRENKTINVNGNNDLQTYSEYGFLLKKMNIDVLLTGSYREETTVYYFNYKPLKSFIRNASFALDLSKDFQNKASISIDFSLNYYNAESNMNVTRDIDYWENNIEFDGGFSFLKSFSIHSNIKTTFRGNNNFFDRNKNCVIFNYSIEKSFLKDNSVSLKLQGNDLFNQNIGIERHLYRNSISESSYNIIKRYFLFSFQWKFNYSRVNK